MTEEDLRISELGAYTNNSMNREGLKKLVDKVNNASGGIEYTAGDNIQISAENVISATDTKYTAGTNIEISEQNVISATDTKYTAGTGITISEQNVISASSSGGGEWTLRTPNDDWSDLFEVVENNIKAKKEMYITIYGYHFYILKDIEVDSFKLEYCMFNLSAGVTNKFSTYGRYSISKNYIANTSATIPRVINYAEFTTDGSSISVNFTSSTGNINKSAFTIYTK